MIKVDVASSPGVLSVPDDFDELVEYTGIKFIPQGDRGARNAVEQAPSLDRVVYRLSFAADISRALSAGATIVEIEAFVVAVPSTPATDQLSVAQRILLGSINAKSKSAAAQFKLIAAVDVDLTAVVNNEKASAVSTKQVVDVSRRTKRIVARSNKGLLDAHLDMPIIESTTLGIDDNQQPDLSPRASAMALLVRGIDPASVASYTTRIDSAHSLAGTGLGAAVVVPRASDSLVRDRYFSLIGASPLAGESSSDYSADAIVPVPMLDVAASLPLVATLVFPAALVEDRVLVRFTLVDAKGIVVDSIEREIDHAENARLFSVPSLPPIMWVSRPRLGLGSAKVTMTQVDEAATAIELYRKSVPMASRSDLAAYTRVLTIDAKRLGPPAVVSVPIDATGPVVFRCVPVGALGTRSHVFSSVVLKPHGVAAQVDAANLRGVSIVARIDAAGIIIEVRNVPPGTIGIDVLRRDAAVARLSPASISKSGIVLAGENVLEPLVFLDESVKQGHVYEYTCVLTDRHGSKHDAAARATIEYVALVENLVDTNLVNELVTAIDDDIDFTFDIVSNVIDTNMQQVKNLLDTSVLIDLFGDEVKDERTLLNKLMAHQVVRHNLTTGEAESFGTITSESFSDRALRGTNGVKPLARRNSYRYDVHALLRSPDTLIESLIARATLSGKQHSFKPAKFLHPLALTQGNITSPESRKRNHARDEMSFGRVGNVATMDLELAGQVPSVIELDVNRLASRRAVIRWRTTAHNDAYDHFIVMRQHLGARSFVAAVHNVSDSGVHEMPYEFNAGDVGALRFIVVPVLSDYSVGQEVMSPEIVVD